MNTAVETNKPNAVQGMSQSRLKCITGLVCVDISLVRMTHGSSIDTNVANKCCQGVKMLSEHFLLIRLLHR